MRKGALRAFFNVVLQPNSIKVIDCKYFVSGDKMWWTFCQKEVPPRDGNGKSEYIPYISIGSKDYIEEIKTKVLELLKIEDIKAVQNDAGEPNSAGSQQQQNKVQAKPQADWLAGL